MLNITQIFCLLIFSVFFTGCLSAGQMDKKVYGKEIFIIDHHCTDIGKIPEKWIEKAKTEFNVTYGHTSHGSQIVSGMVMLKNKSQLYNFDRHELRNSLTLYDKRPNGDLGYPDRKEWARKTYHMLKEDTLGINIVMWSWCGQVSRASEGDIETYLHLMTELENLFPEVTFIYMTGHLDGTGEYGNLNLRNDQIREYCMKNKKVLYDFADIESFDPDGNYYLDRRARDNCEYFEWGKKRNWAEDWCNTNPGRCTQYPCAHTKSLNCDLKANAFWWMLARLAGWYPEK